MTSAVMYCCNVSVDVHQGEAEGDSYSMSDVLGEKAVCYIKSLVLVAVIHLLQIYLIPIVSS